MKIVTNTTAMLLLAGLGLSPVAHAHGDRCGNPFQTADTVALGVGVSGAVGEFKVPQGYRLQIEYVSAGLRLASADGRAAFAIGTTVGGGFAWHPLTSDEGFAATDRQTTGAVTLYADAASLVKIEIDRNVGADVAATGRYAVTGCLYPVRQDGNAE